jgi:shikimate kinase
MGNYNFLDTDQIIEKAAGMSITEIFEKEGEEAFRQVEKQVLQSVYPYVRCVISTGGGIVCTRDNWSKLQTGIVIWINVPADLLYERVKDNKDRPLLQSTTNQEQSVEEKQEQLKQKISSILESRRDLYSQADVTIDVTEDNMTPNDVANLIVRTLHDYIDNNPPAWKLAKAKAQADGLDWVK